MLTDSQFTALAQLLRLRPGPAQDAARLVMVQGLPTADAARQLGMDYRAASYSVKRVRAGLKLAEAVGGRPCVSCENSFNKAPEQIR